MMMNTMDIRALIKKYFYKLSMPHEQYNYYMQAKKAYSKKKYKDAIKLLNKAVAQYPEVYRFHALLVEIATKKRKWKKAAQHWEVVFRLRKRKPKIAAYLSYSRALCRSKKYKKA